MTLSSSSLRVCPWMNHGALWTSFLYLIKAFGLDIFQSLNTLIFIFFFHPGSLGKETGEVLFTLN